MNTVLYFMKCVALFLFEIYVDISLTRKIRLMDSESGMKDCKRKTRNLSEKKRRDQFNILINELSTMVSANCRKMDKSTVLKSVISVLKSHSEVITKSRMHEIENSWKPSFLTNEEFVHLVLEAIDGFIIVFSVSGQIFYVSESITPLLGQLVDEVANGTFYKMVYEGDRTVLFNMLSNFQLKENHISFCCRLQRGKSENDNSASYEIINFLGFLKTNRDYISNIGISSDECSSSATKIDTKVAFVGVGRLQKPQLTKQFRMEIFIS
ncbi:Helix-loop-helix DNA-binding domain [Popillia japonica]|uniref:Helix-loop-helix DNA-binding domain n=1 Tax=Popillia japonica TaxID=7064 RepID=A0AAW1JCZ3_POPJA